MGAAATIGGVAAVDEVEMAATEIVGTSVKMTAAKSCLNSDFCT